MSYNINNKDQRFSEIQNTIGEIIIKYAELLHGYMNHFTENIYIQKRETYNYTFKKGISTITHVFNLMFMKSYNIDLAIEYAQRASYYFVEFINQLGDEHQSILGLGPKDATLFAYKKTIFDITDDIPESKENTTFINNLTKTINYYNNIITYIMENTKISSDNKTTILDRNISNVSKEIMNSIASYEEYGDKIHVLHIFTEYVLNKQIDCDETICIIELFTKMLVKHDINATIINKKLLNHNCEANLLTNHNKFMKWLFMYN